MPGPEPICRCTGAARATAPRSSRGRPGFTILEILLSIAIIGLLAGVLITGSTALLNTKPASVDEVFWLSVQEARKRALQFERPVILRFSKDRERGMGFELVDGQETTRFPLPPAAAPSDLQVEFLSTQKSGNTVMIAGVVLDTDTLPSVTFFSDGTCTPFRLQVARAMGVHHLEIDPWTCAQVLKAPDPFARP